MTNITKSYDNETFGEWLLGVHAMKQRRAYDPLLPEPRILSQTKILLLSHHCPFLVFAVYTSTLLQSFYQDRQ